MRYLLLLPLFLIFGKSIAQDSISVEIAPWKDNKKAAVVFTFDDWSPGHGKIVYPMFKRYGLPATFFVTLKNKQLGGGVPVMKKAYEDGFEIGNHTHTHADLSTLNSYELQKEIIDAQSILRKEVHPKCANTFAFPYGVFTPDVLKKTKETHIGARTAGLSYGRMWEYSLMYGKTDYFQLQTFMARDIHSPSLFDRLAKSAMTQGGMIVFMYHSIYNESVNDKWFGAISENLLESQLKAIKNHEDKLWITTFEKAIMYHKERANTSFSISRKKKSLNLKIENTLKKDQFFEPLTFLLDGIEVDKIKSISEKGRKGKIQYKVNSNGSSIMFETLPFGKQIIIEFKSNKRN